MRTIIVDDEPLARRLVREHVSAVTDAVVVAECGNGFEAVKAIQELAPDVVLIDVQMPKLNGFEVLELVEGSFAVIFVTAHDEHALRAFEVNAVDYLLKPVDAARFRQAWEKAISAVQRKTLRPVRTLGALGQKRTDRILIRDGGNVHVVPAEAIDVVLAQDDYVEVRAGGKKYLKQQTMGEMEAQLDPQRFVRIHRSTIINIDRLAKIELYAKDSRVATLKDGSTWNVSRAGYDLLRQLLDR
ncbi:MAG: LytTR family DNA-binding domain-containing protein [Bacteroidetes bacterium]|nr:LytTR family DNA-binding domain-containing protein [Bacteroidota bacterium]